MFKRISEMAIVHFDRFIEQQQIPYTLIGVFLNDENKKETTGDHKDWSLEQVEIEFENQKKRLWKDSLQMTKGRKDKEPKKRLVKYAKSLRFKYVEDWFIIDIDEPEIIDIEQIYSINGFEIFRNSPYKRGTTKGFHIFVKIKNLPKYKCETDVFNDIKGDLIKFKNNLWCYHNDDIQMFNFNEENRYDVFDFESIKSIFNLKHMNFEDNKTKKKDVKKEIEEESIITETATFDEDLKMIHDYNEIDKKDYLSEDYHNVLRGIRFLKIERIDNFNMWIKSAFIFMNEFTEDCGFKLWLEFSKRGSKFIDKESLFRYWNNLKIKSHIDGEIKLGTFFYWVREDDIAKGFFIDEEDIHYVSNQMINYPDIQYPYKIAIDSKTDFGKAELVNYLYPNYFVSDGRNLYILNYYGIYKKIEGEGMRFLKKIYDGVIMNLYKCITHIMQNHIVDTEETINEKKKIRGRILLLIDSFQYISLRDKVTQALIQICIEPELATKMDELNPHLIGFDNGVFDIKKKLFRKGKKEDFISMSTGYKYYDFDLKIENNKKMECYNIIRSLFRTEEYTRHFVKRLAFMMDGQKTRQEFDFFIGAGGNGKSLISESIISKVFGRYSTIMSSNYFMTPDKDSNRATPELVQAKGTRYVFVSEPDTNTGSKMQTNKIKVITGSDRIKCRLLRENPIEYIPQFSLIFLVNDFPDLSSIDGGILRRPVITEFPFLFRKPEDIPDFGVNPDVKEIDTTLETKCDHLKLFFFKLFVEHFDKDYKVIEDVKESINVYKESVDPIGCWIKQFFVPSTNPKDRIKLKDFVECYNIDKEAKATSKEVSKSIGALGYIKKLSVGVNMVEKIKLKEGVEDILKKYLSIPEQIINTDLLDVKI